MTDALKNIEIEKMAVAELMEMKKPLIFQYLINIFPPCPIPLSQGEKGRVRSRFHYCHEKKMLKNDKNILTNKKKSDKFIKFFP